MNTKIVLVTTEGPSREDGSVYYCNALVVSSPTLKFDEPVFKDLVKDGQAAKLGLIDTSKGETATFAFEKIPDYLRSIGYTVADIPQEIICLDGGC